MGSGGASPTFSVLAGSRQRERKRGNNLKSHYDYDFFEDTTRPKLESALAPNPRPIAEGEDPFGNHHYYLACAASSIIEQPSSDYSQPGKKAIDDWIQAEKENRSNPA